MKHVYISFIHRDLRFSHPMPLDRGCIMNTSSPIMWIYLSMKSCLTKSWCSR